MTWSLRIGLNSASILFLAATALASTPVVTVTSPASNATVDAPVHFVATATSPSCSQGISAIRIYSAPGVSAYTVSGGQLNGYISLANGAYNTTVVAWDNCGGVGSAPVAITVKAQSAPAGFLYVTNSNWSPNTTSTVNNVIGYTIVAGGKGALAQTLQGPVTTNIFPLSVASDKGGYRLYVGDYASGDVYAYYIYGNDGYLYPVPGSPFPVNRSVTAVAVHPSGDYVFAARNEDAAGDGIEVFEVQSDGSLVQAPGSPYATENGPRTMVVDPSGKYLYVGDDYDYLEAFKIGANGSLTPLPGAPYAMTGGGECGVNPNDIIDTVGTHLYTADRGDNSISGYDINSSTGVPTQISGSPWSSEGGCDPYVLPSLAFDPFSLAIDGTGKFLYGLNGDIESISIFKINQSTGALTWVQDTTNTTGMQPGPIRTDPTGNYIYATGNGGIVVYTINHSTGALTASPSSPIPVPETGNAYWTSFAVAPPQ